MVLSETINILRNWKKKYLGGPKEVYHRFKYIAPSSDLSLLTHNLAFKVILRRFEVVFWCLEWEIENAALFKRLTKINSNLPMIILYYDFNNDKYIMYYRPVYLGVFTSNYKINFAIRT